MTAAEVESRSRGARSRPPPRPLISYAVHQSAKGTRVADRYLLTSMLATGATASVWRATDQALDRPVALKILHPHLMGDSDLVARFANEACLTATVSHPSLVGIHDTVMGPTPAIVLEFVDGPDLRKRLDAGPCSVAEVLSLGWVIADALDVAHRAGMIHRDVKPANIICTAGGQPKLGDFGIATAAPGDRTATGLVLGTAKYLAPEQVRGGTVDARTDVYALCVVLYEALCGRAPFERTGDLPTAMARLEESPRLPRTIRPDIPIGVEAIVLRGLARDPDSRWPSAAALRDAIGVEAESLGLALGPLDLSSVAVEYFDTPVASPQEHHGHSSSPSPTRVIPRGEATTDPSIGRRRRWPRRAFGTIIVGAVLALGIGLVLSSNLTSELTNGLVDRERQPSIGEVSAYDPEGTGPPGEHDDLAERVLDGDPATSWNTEMYDDRDLGAKRGVGLVFELSETSSVRAIDIRSDGTDWAAEIYVSDTLPTELDGWGPPRAVATGLGSEATLRPDQPGRAVLLWITDLGRSGPPYRLEIDDVTIS
jgi:serine/threonine protein kinase